MGIARYRSPPPPPAPLHSPLLSSCRYRSLSSYHYSDHVDDHSHDSSQTQLHSLCGFLGCHNMANRTLTITPCGRSTSNQFIDIIITRPSPVFQVFLAHSIRPADASYTCAGLPPSSYPPAASAVPTSFAIPASSCHCSMRSKLGTLAFPVVS
jgi:hypothetical protein